MVWQREHDVTLSLSKGERPIMQTTEPERILAELGVTPATLTGAERSALDEDGFIVLERIIDEGQLTTIRAAVEELLAASRRDLTKRHGGTLHLDDLLDGSAAFDPAWTSPRLLAAVAHVLGADFRASAVTYRGPQPGYGAQALHADDVGLAAADPFRVATAIVPLVDFTTQNGATRVVPGSHRVPLYDAPAEPDRSHPRERTITAPAGSAIVFNGHLWHSGTRNASSTRRDALQIVFRRRGGRAPATGPNASNATLDRLGAAALLLI
jgi:ectoine hydroxylase-related dioxygenase (phytanoyl-CoA dioxygenase family)